MNQGIENILGSKVFQGAKCVKEQRVLRSKVFQGAKGVKEQSVLRSKVFQGAKCVKKQSKLLGIRIIVILMEIIWKILKHYNKEDVS